MAFVNLLDVVYPVGSVYSSSVSTSPAALVGGTWTRIEGAALRGTGTNETDGYLGSDQHVLTVDEMPSHEHKTNIPIAQYNGGDDNYWVSEIRQNGNRWYGTAEAVGGGRRTPSYSVRSTSTCGTALPKNCLRGDVACLTLTSWTSSTPWGRIISPQQKSLHQYQSVAPGQPSKAVGSCALRGTSIPQETLAVKKSTHSALTKCQDTNTETPKTGSGNARQALILAISMSRETEMELATPTTKRIITPENQNHTTTSHHILPQIFGIESPNILEGVA